jgi:hypothetical protein
MIVFISKSHLRSRLNIIEINGEKRGMFEPQPSYRATVNFSNTQVFRRAAYLGGLFFGYIFFAHQRKVTRQ